MADRRTASDKAHCGTPSSSPAECRITPLDRMSSHDMKRARAQEEERFRLRQDRRRRQHAVRLSPPAREQIGHARRGHMPAAVPAPKLARVQPARHPLQPQDSAPAHATTPARARLRLLPAALRYGTACCVRPARVRPLHRRIWSRPLPQAHRALRAHVPAPRHRARHAQMQPGLFGQSYSLQTGERLSCSAHCRRPL